MRIVKQNILLKAVYTSGVNYPAPSNLTYLWNYGSLALLCLVIQIITGIFLAMYYTGEVSQAFLSIEHIMRDVNYGWLLRYIHANGASMFFTVVYIHLFRGLYYGSYSAPRELLWCTGVVIVLVMIITAFLGYVLPWGQMSFWAATVITNLCSAIPVIGLDVVYFLWGGFSVDNATLGRFFSLHFFLPFILTGLIIIHLIFLHENGSNNPLGIECKVDNAPFSPYFTIKDLYGVVVFLGFFGLFVFYMPDVLGHPDNYMEANPLVTPSHIVPEWYFLPFYGILRSIPDKLGGVIALVGSIIVLLLLPYMIKGEIRSGQFRPMYKGLFWFILIISLILGWIGGHSIKYPFYDLGQIATVLYFLYIVGILPTVVFIEYVIARVSLSRLYGMEPKPFTRYSGNPVGRNQSTKRYKLESLQSDLPQTLVQRGVRVIYYGYKVFLRPLVSPFMYSPVEKPGINIPQYKLLKTVKLWHKVKLIFKDRRGLSWVHR